MDPLVEEGVVPMSSVSDNPYVVTLDDPVFGKGTMLIHESDCSLLTTHHLTCTCEAHTRWYEFEKSKHSPTCAWVRRSSDGYGNAGNCDCGQVR